MELLLQHKADLHATDRYASALEQMAELNGTGGEALHCGMHTEKGMSGCASCWSRKDAPPARVPCTLDRNSVHLQHVETSNRLQSLIARRTGAQ